MSQQKSNGKTSKKNMFSLSLGVTIFAVVAVGMIVVFAKPFNAPAPKEVVRPTNLEQVEPELADAITGTEPSDAKAEAPEIALPESAKGLSAELPLKPGVPVGMHFAPMQKADDVPHATGTRVEIDGHVFYRRNMMWLEAGYNGTLGPSIEVGSDAANAIIKKEPYLAKATQLGPIVSVRVDGKWCFFHSVRAQ